MCAYWLIAAYWLNNSLKSVLRKHTLFGLIRCGLDSLRSGVCVSLSDGRLVRGVWIVFLAVARLMFEGFVHWGGRIASERADDVAPLRNLRGRDGVLAVSGNHEAFYGFAAWKAVYESWSIRFLERVYAGPLAAHRSLQLRFSPRTVSVRLLR